MLRNQTRIRKFAFATILIFAATGRTEPLGVPANMTDARVAHEVDAAEVSFITALTAVDIPKLEQVLTEDFTWTHTSGDAEAKRDYLRGLQETRRYRALQREGTSFRIYDRAALSSGIVHVTVFTADRGERVLHIRYTAAYVMQNGRWRLAAWHNTRLAE